MGVCVALLLLFFGVFSHPKKKLALPGENPRGEASLGRKVTPGQENNDPTKAATPMLSADVRSTDPALAGQLTPEDIDRTSRTGMARRPTAPNTTATKPPQDYALSKVDFSDPSVGQGTTTPKLTIGRTDWRSAGTWLISLSESHDQQEAMLVMGEHSWLQTELGRFVLEPEPRRPWVARLVLVSAPQE